MNELTLHYGHTHQVSRAPIALNKTPGARHIDRIPRVPEPVALEFYPRLVSGRFAVALNNHTVEASVAVWFRFVHIAHTQRFQVVDYWLVVLFW